MSCIPINMRVLMVFCALTAVNGFAWLLFDPAVAQLKRDFHPVVGDAQVDLLSSWQPIAYICSSAFVMWALMQKEGMQRVMRVGAFLELIGAVLKAAALATPHNNAGLALLNIGQIFSGTVAPIAIGTPAHLSAVWFPDHQRTRATGAAVLFNNVGNAVAYILVPALADRVGYAAVLITELLAATAVAVATMLFVPEQPKRRTAHNAEGNFVPVNIGLELKQLITNRNMLILCVVYAWSSGGYVAWTSLFDDLLSGRWSDTFIGFMTFSSTVAYVVGGAVTAYLVDSRWHPKMKEVLMGSCFAGMLGALLLTLSVPSAFDHANGGLVLDFGDAWIFLMGTLSGLFNGCAAPVFYELAAELTFPVSEGISGNVLSLAENVGSLALYQIVFHFATPKTMNIVYTAGMLITVGLLALVRAKYLRTEGCLLADYGDPREIDNFETASNFDTFGPPVNGGVSSDGTRHENGHGNGHSNGNGNVNGRGYLEPSPASSQKFAALLASSI